jgi:geranylgeranyl diphosphate synthase type II
MKKMYSVEELQELINNEIATRSEALKELHPADLYSPVNYSLEIGGKRLRPVLLLLSYNLFSDEIMKALPSAIAIEVFHNFTLLHDDIMDKADVRRNQPTVHKKFDENSAILSGDAMAFLSYKYLLENKSEQLVEVIELFSKTAIEVCEGQQFDMDFENRLDVSESEYLEMIRLKTAVLLACSLKAGALIANASATEANFLYEYGINLGLAFQLQDDLLDSFGDQKTFGKRIGGDILANKKTFLLINALETVSPELKEGLLDWVNKKDFVEENKISAVKEIYTQLNIKELTQQKIDFYFQKASNTLQNLSIDENKLQPLFVLGNRILKRNN